MKLDLKNLPQDPTLLTQMVLDLIETLKNYQRHNEQLQHQLAVLKRNYFGRKSEKVDANQLQLAFAELNDIATGLAIGQTSLPEVQEKDNKIKKGHGRKALSEDLPREEIKLELAADEKRCDSCNIEMEEIGKEVSEQLEYVPASFYVKKFVRIKYACKNCHIGVKIAEKPPQPIEKSIAGAGLLAHVVVSKYCDHLPLYRQESILKRHGVKFNRSTMCNWVGGTARLLEPIYNEMIREVLQSKKIHTDDTILPVQDKKLKNTRKGRIWVYAGDRDHPQIVFDYTPTRQSRAGPVKFLEGFKGKYLQADAFPGYDQIYAPGDVIEVACWAHARRKFYDAESTDPAGSLAAVAFVKLLYEVEQEAKDTGISDEQLKTLRQERSKPILDTFKNWMLKQQEIILPKSPLGQAIAYALSNWQALNNYLKDGILDIDNNFAERELRRITLGRKNFMFAGSDQGGKWAAILYSLIATCKHHNIEPWAYLRDILENISTHPANRINELLPNNWKTIQETIKTQ